MIDPPPQAAFSRVGDGKVYVQHLIREVEPPATPTQQHFRPLPHEPKTCPRSTVRLLYARAMQDRERLAAWLR